MDSWDEPTAAGGEISQEKARSGILRAGKAYAFGRLFPGGRVPAASTLHVGRSRIVTLRLTRWRGWKGRALLLVLALALTPLPAAASEAASKTPAPAAPPVMTSTSPSAATRSQVSLKDSAVRAAARTPLAPAARRAEQGSAGKDSPAFFKTKGGAVALAVMVLGVGYALYSVKHDRITSPAKQ
jgi:hypothetical protein